MSFQKSGFRTSVREPQGFWLCWFPNICPGTARFLDMLVSAERYVLLRGYQREFANNDIDRGVFRGVSSVSGGEIEVRGREMLYWEQIAAWPEINFPIAQVLTSRSMRRGGVDALLHRRRRTTKRWELTTVDPEGQGCRQPSTESCLLTDVRTSLSSAFLVSGLLELPDAARSNSPNGPQSLIRCCSRISGEIYWLINNTEFRKRIRNLE